MSKDAEAITPGGATENRASRPDLSAAARRALAEAEARREALVAAAAAPETQGRGGLEPTRYGDWEVKGIASDF